jgi:hypothetical protein
LIVGWFRTYIRCQRERKREAGTPVDEPEVKKPRLADIDAEPAEDIEPESSVATPYTPLIDEDVLMEGMAEEPTTSTPQQAVAKGKGKVKGDSGFKENPYTYLASDDPILQSCMYVYFSSYFDAWLRNICVEHDLTSTPTSRLQTCLSATLMATLCVPFI